MESSVVGYLAYNGLLPLSTSSQVEILNQDFRAECLPKWLSGQEWKGVMGSSSHLGSPWMRQAPHRLGFDHLGNPGNGSCTGLNGQLFDWLGFQLWDLVTQRWAYVLPCVERMSGGDLNLTPRERGASQIALKGGKVPTSVQARCGYSMRNPSVEPRLILIN